MNTKNLSLSSNSTNYTYIGSLLELEDLTTLNVILSGVTESYIPLNLEIDWGDGTIEYFDNNTYKNYREESIINEVLYGKFSSIFQNTYSKIYYPSETTLFKQLSAQFYLKYSNGDTAWFIIPIEIRSYDYFEAIYDLKLLNTTILPLTANNKKHTFATEKDGFIIESYS